MLELTLENDDTLTIKNFDSANMQLVSGGWVFVSVRRTLTNDVKFYKNNYLESTGASDCTGLATSCTAIVDNTASILNFASNLNENTILFGGIYIGASTDFDDFETFIMRQEPYDGAIYYNSGRLYAKAQDAGQAYVTHGYSSAQEGAVAEDALVTE